MAGIPPRITAAAVALLAHPRLEDAAKAIGISSRTLRRWRVLPAFDRALGAERRRMVADATDALRLGSIEAVDILREIMRDPECSAAVRVQAASCVLANAFRAVEISDISARIDALEEDAANAK